jgi:FixJ family two-component response regulator
MDVTTQSEDGSNISITVIDDDESSRDGITRLVRSLGFVAHAFHSARAFLNSQQLNKTSCLISDIQMPEMSGIQLQDALRRLGHNIPIIFVTAFPYDDVRDQALAGGAICFLSKPLKGEALLRCLDTALKSKH